MSLLGLVVLLLVRGVNMLNLRIESYKKSIYSLFDSVCTIYSYEKVFNEKTKRYESKEVEKYKDIKCRISFKKSSASDNSEFKSQSQTQIVKLFMPSDIELLIDNDMSNYSVYVTNINTKRVLRYRLSSAPSVFTFHQEMELQIDKDIP